MKTEPIEIVEDDTLERLISSLKLLHDLFGADVEVHTNTVHGTVFVVVWCRGCRQKNRLTNGIRCSICTRCKIPLVIPLEAKAVN